MSQFKKDKKRYIQEIALALVDSDPKYKKKFLHMFASKIDEYVDIIGVEISYDRMKTYFGTAGTVAEAYAYVKSMDEGVAGKEKRRWWIPVAAACILLVVLAGVAAILIPQFTGTGGYTVTTFDFIS